MSRYIGELDVVAGVDNVCALKTHIFPLLSRYHYACLVQIYHHLFCYLPSDYKSIWECYRYYELEMEYGME